jgi:hypothetical protein
MAYSTYWAGVPLDRGEVYVRDRRAVGAWPTNDGLVMTYVGAPAEDFAEFRRDPEASLLAALDPITAQGISDAELLATAIVAGTPMARCQAERFLGVIAGSVALRDYLTPRDMLRVIGARGIAKVALGKLRGTKHYR